MSITFFTFVISIFWSSMLIVALYFLRKKYSVHKKAEVFCLFTIYLFCVLRMFLPVDLPFSKGISMEGVYSEFYRYLYLEKIRVGDLQIPFAVTLAAIWISVAVFLLWRFGIHYYHIMKEITMYQPCNTKQCEGIFQGVISESRKKLKIEILQTDTIKIPLAIGVIRKRIILPKIEYTDTELHYIIQHEYTHFLNGDLLLKLLVHIYCCIFWWNPLVYFLKKDLDQTLEIKCDLTITEGMSQARKAEYLKTVVSSLKKAGNSGNMIPMYGTTALVERNKEEELLERFKFILNSSNVKNTSKVVLTVILGASVLLFLSSYIYVPLPSYEPDITDIETDPGAHAITTENSYIVEEEKGSFYWIAFDGTKQQIDEELVSELEEEGFEVRRKAE